MEMNRRRSKSRSRSRPRCFMVANLIPFQKPLMKPQTNHNHLHQDLYNNVHYTTCATSTSYASQSPHQHHFNNNYITATDTTPPLPSSKVSFLLQPSAASGEGSSKWEETESVDVRADSFISSVRARFKLDHCERLATTTTSSITVISLDNEE